MKIDISILYIIFFIIYIEIMASLKRRFNYFYNYSKKNYEDGSVYKGKMKRGKPHGFGKIKKQCTDGVQVYKGDFWYGQKYWLSVF